MFSVICILGAVASAFTILESVFTNLPKGRSALLPVRAGFHQKGTMGDRIGSIHSWNNNSDRLGKENNLKFGTGDLIEVRVSQESGQQDTYVSLHASNDAVCVVYVVTAGAGGDRYTWLDHFGRLCGLRWYPSNVYVSDAEARNQSLHLKVDSGK